MSMKNDGGPAFPGLPENIARIGQDGICRMEPIQTHGMTLRDWFAGMALQGLITRVQGYENFDSHAIIAYKIADHMLAQREKP